MEVYLEPHLRPPHLIVLAATPVALSLLRWAREVGYTTTLVEARSGRLTAEFVEAADRAVPSLDLVPVDRATQAVHTDHDAPLVPEALARLLREEASFVGVMGSARHSARHLQALEQMGLPAELVARVRTPVGLDIGARTPQEIALSILGGLLAARSERPGGWLDRE
ncbi:MAG: XdhC family protein [Actinomycetota bacterium]